MRIYHFHYRENFAFAQAGRRGTWFPPGVKICPECNRSRQARVSPLIIEWEAGSNLVGDFVWPGLGSDLVVSQSVKDSFKERFREVEYKTVEFWQDPKIKQPTKVTKRSKLRIWLPYNGPTLWDTIPIKWCHLDHGKSNVSILKVCLTCGKTIYKTPPWHERKLVIDTATWDGEDIFHIHEYPGGIFCTEQVKEFVEQAGFTNVAFLEDGEIPDT